MVKSLCIAAVLFAPIAAETHTNLRHLRISPALDPTSSSKFLKDYPDDGRPDVKGLKKGGFHDFTPPFPAVQGSDDFDKDYVKDENRDNGEWKAQADYDRIKLQWRKVKDALNKAQGVESGDRGNADAATGKANDAAGKAAGGKVKSEKAAKWRKELEKEERAAAEKEAQARAAAGNTTKHDVPKGPVEAAQWALDKEEKDFKKCEEELKEAQEHLKAVEELMAKKKKEQEAKDEADKKKAAKDAEEASAKAEELKKQGKDLESEEAKDDKEAADADLVAGAAQKESDGKKRAYEKGQMTVAEAKANLEKAEAEMSKAEMKLKAFRGELPAGKPLVATPAAESNSVTGFFGRLVAKLR